MNTDAFVQDIFIGENSRKKKKNQFFDFRPRLTARKESADVS